MIKILIVDDHPIVRRGLKQILSDEPDMAIPGEAQNASEALNLAQKESWDIVILDITMPGKSGLDVLKELRQNYPKMPVLVLSIHPEDQYAVRALKTGAAGYLTKESAPEELVKAIRKIMSRGKYVSPSLAERLAFDLEKEGSKAPHLRLSNREYQVMVMIAAGKRLSDIAIEMSLSVKTISTYRTRILQKMGFRNNAEITHYGIKNMLVE
ncbi:MAG: DNA-binding response regulator [Syntrophus sp. (in: bacteria)]|nr:DNA-binding response regulator [Syntrophus sp. (in: bacteria)]